MSEAESGKLYTLTEVSKQTKISMPTLQRYKKLYQDQIPSQGEGRSQRYPASALDVFRRLKDENQSRRGRPRKSAGAPAKKAGKAVAKAAPAKRGRRKKAGAAKKGPARKAAGGNLLTLTEISKKTKISYPTLLRYVTAHLNEIPHEGEGRGRRYPAAAVGVFKRIYSESSRGRGAKKKKAAGAPKKRRGPGRPPKKAAAKTAKRRGRPPAAAASSNVTAQIKALEKANKALARKVAKLEKELSKPYKIWVKR